MNVQDDKICTDAAERAAIDFWLFEWDCEIGEIPIPHLLLLNTQ
jgi:hypothetical protein